MPAVRVPRSLPTATIGGGVSLLPAALIVLPATTSKVEGATQALTWTITDANGVAITVQKAGTDAVLTPIAVTFASDDTDVATVHATTGVITAVAEGECVVTGTITGTSITDTVAVTVTAAP